MFLKRIVIVAVLLFGPLPFGTPANVCPAAPFRPSYSPGMTVTTPCSSVHPSLNPRGVITWQCLPDFTWEGDWSGCTFPEGVVHAVAPLAYRVAAGASEVNNSIQAIVSEVQALFQIASLATFGDIHVAYIGPGGDSAETILVLTMQVEYFFVQSSFNMVSTISTQMNYTLAGLLASPLWVGGPALRHFQLCSCPLLWSSLKPDLAPGRPVVNLCLSPDYIDTTCNCQGLQSNTACVCSKLFITLEYPGIDGRVCRLDTDGDGIPNADPGEVCEGCCLAEFFQGYEWPRTLHDITSEVLCSSSHNRLGSFALRTCKPNGQWSSVDMSKCVLTDSTLGAIVILASVDQQNADNALQDVDGLLQQFNLSLATYAVSGLSLRAAYTSAGTTTLVIEGDVPLMTNTAILSEFQMAGSPPGPVSFLQPPSVYGFQPVDECPCSPQEEGVNNGNWIQICSSSYSTACYCSQRSDCQCLDPFVNTSSDPLVKCSIDSDGDRIPDHLDNEPFIYASSLKPPHENCQTTVAQSCPVDTTSSPDISWSKTPPCVYDVQRCSTLLNETVGLAYRLCDQSGMWAEPDVSDCQSVALRNIETTVSNILMAIVGSTIITEGGTLTLSPTDVETLANTTQTLLYAMLYAEDALLPADLNTTVVYLHSMARIAENTNLLATGEFDEMTLFSIVDYLLLPRNDPAWPAADTEHYSAAVALLNAIEKLSIIVANNLDPGRMFTFASNNFVIKARSIAMNQSGSVQFDGGAAANITVSIPESIVHRGTGSVVVTFLNRLAYFLPRVYANQSSLEINTKPSAIVSIQVTEVKGLPDTLNISPIHLQFEGINGSPVCVFWNYSGNTTQYYVIGGWSEDGLTTHHSNGSTVVNCSSRHLTSFAVLVNAAGTRTRNPVLSRLNQILSYCGCAVSLLCLVVTIAFLLVTMRKMKRERDHKAMLSNFVLCNLCIALACGLLVFLVGIEGALSIDGTCKTVAFLLHYFFLAAFFWMLCEAVMMYNLLVKVFHTSERKWACIYLILGWVPPLPIVVTTIAYAIPHEQYTTTSRETMTPACWLSSVNGTRFAFIAPMLLILLVNVILLTFVMRSLFKFYRDSRRRQFRADTAENEAKYLAWKLFKAFIIILPLLGFTWVIGLFALAENTVTVAFATVFVILNSLQGTAIFFCFVVRSDQVWPKIVSLCKFCCSRKPSKIATTNRLSPPCVPISDSAMNNWTLAVAKSDTAPSPMPALTVDQSVLLSSPLSAALSATNGAAGEAIEESSDLSDDHVLWK